MTHLDDGADLRAVMDRSLRDLDAPDHCGPAALATGRRIRTRRRVTISLAGVAAVAAVAALTLPALGGSGGASPQFADDPTSSPAPSDVPDPQSDEGWWDAPGTRLAEQLARSLPEGVTLETVDTTQEGVPAGSDDEMIGGLLATLSASTGPGAFQIILYAPELVARTDGGSGVETSTPSLGTPSSAPAASDDAVGDEAATLSGTSHASRIKCRPYMDSCEPIEDGSGEQVGRLTTNVESGTTYYEAVLLGPDGGALFFYVADSTGEKPGYEAPTAEVPPLTLEQLRTLAEDPVWTSYQP